MPNVGKSTTFNIMCNMSVPAENFPFCTIDPTEARVELSDPNFKHLLEKFHPKSEVPAFLSVVDIAGLVKGAAEGEGLGNAFLSHINATDAIFNVVRVFEETMVNMLFSVFGQTPRRRVFACLLGQPLILDGKGFLSVSGQTPKHVLLSAFLRVCTVFAI
tara:strand:+ start:1183 stop:1662 length:480 start_codon:yes stop_codon:yes gene_type:complete